MRTIKIGFLAAMLLSALLVAVVAAEEDAPTQTYEDTAALRQETVRRVRARQYINNGDFNEWAGGLPVGWTVSLPASADNWEARLAQSDLARGGEDRGVNYAPAFFFRAGSDGSAYADMWQQVDPALTGGEYWVQIHATAWQENVRSPFNSVAWYGFSDSADPASVTEWRELLTDAHICANGDQRCPIVSRREIVEIAPGSYLHLRFGMKFPDHQAWTLFMVDDISITGLNAEAAPLPATAADLGATGQLGDDGFIRSRGQVRWDATAPR